MLYHDRKASRCCNRFIFSLTTSEVLRHSAPVARGSVQKFDNYYDVIFVFKM